MAALVLVHGLARADDTDTCSAAFLEAQDLLAPGEGKLLEARDRLRLCAQPTCGRNLPGRCAEMLIALESRVPSAVFVAQDAAGRDVPDVSVMVDGRPLVARLDGLAREIDPGEHLFVFTTATGIRKEVRATITEGRKSQAVVASFEVSLDPSGPRRSLAESPGPAHSGIGFRRGAGVAVGGAGVVALGIAGWLGLETLSTVTEASRFCDGGRCEQRGADLLGEARATQTFAIIALVAGVMGVGAGTYLVATAPTPGARLGWLDGPTQAARRGAF